MALLSGVLPVSDGFPLRGYCLKNNEGDTPRRTGVAQWLLCPFGMAGDNGWLAISSSVPLRWIVMMVSYISKTTRKQPDKSTSHSAISVHFKLSLCLCHPEINTSSFLVFRMAVILYGGDSSDIQGICSHQK